MGYAGEVKAKRVTLEPADFKELVSLQLFKTTTKSLYISEHRDEPEWKYPLLLKNVANLLANTTER